jgi:uncharacterized protein
MAQQDYARKARILRRIMSSKAAHYSLYDTVINLLTVLVAALVTFVGFYGSSKFHNFLVRDFGFSGNIDSFDFYFNLFTFSLLVLIFAQIFLRFGQRKTSADSAIVELSSFINFIIDRTSDRASQGFSLSETDLEVIREKYRSIITSIPSNTDEEYRKARMAERSASTNSAKLDLTLSILGSDVYEAKALSSIIEQRPDLLAILQTARGVGQNLWIGGGVFRNAVWDTLHGYQACTAIDDIDLVHFNPKFIDKKFDEKIEFEITNLAPNQRWSVKNQARMHLHNSEPAYLSLEDAISRWPETCTAFCVQLKNNDEISIIRPHKLTDLFSLVVRPTLAFTGREQRLEQRASEKNWRHKWPRLRFFL